MNCRAIAASLLIAIGAASGGLEAAERVRGHSIGAPALPIGKLLQPLWSQVSPDARIFLVAGGRDSANFAQEVVDQKKFWMARGYSAQQIECFYAVPPAEQDDDAEQFLSLEVDLRDCHLAAPDIIFGALAEVARKYRQDFFYLYVSSHGTGPLRERPLSRNERRDPGSAWYIRAHAEAADPASSAYKWFSPYWMEVEGTGNKELWASISFFERYVKAQQNPEIRVEDQLFTPRYLAQALQKFPGKVRKVVVLQACHSGGFLLPPDKAPAPEETLVTVQNITVLTASRSDRTSFGCDTADHTTYYGGALQEVLSALPGKKIRIPEQDWLGMHEQIAQKVQQLEVEREIPEDQRSLPQYFSNTAAGKK
jgi:hypothetical protein